MDAGIFVAGETGEAHFALFLGFAHGFSGAVWTDEQLGIVVEGDAVNLPEVEMVRLEATQRLFEHLHGEGGFAAVSADFSHEKNFVTPALKGAAHPGFGFAVVIFPAVVEKSDAAVDGFLDDASGGLKVFCRTEVVAAEAEGGDLLVVATQLAHGDGVVGSLGLCGGEHTRLFRATRKPRNAANAVVRLKFVGCAR